MPVLDFASYLGGSGYDQARDVVTDSAGNIYVTGGTDSADFLTTAGAYDRTANGNVDVFVIKLDPTGQSIIWSTLLGGPNYDRAYAIELDSANNVIVGGRAGAGFPTTSGVVQKVFAGDTDPESLYGLQDGFLAKLSADGTQLLWATYWGTGDRGIVRDFAVDAADNVYPASSIEAGHSSQHITAGTFHTTPAGGRDGLVAKLNATAGAVLWCTYIGGTGNETGTPSIRADDTGVYYLAHSISTDALTTAGAYDRSANGGTDMYVAKLAPNGASLLWATYLGGAANEFTETHGLAVDGQHNVYVAATTLSANFPTTPGVLQPHYGGSGGAGTGQGTNYPGDGFVAKLSSGGTQLMASTYLGGTLGEGVEGVSVGADGSVYVSGATFSSNFPATADAAQPSNHGSGDMFAARLSADFTQILYATYAGGSALDYARSSIFDGATRFVILGETEATNFPTHSARFPAYRGGSQDAFIVDIRVAGSF